MDQPADAIELDALLARTPGKPMLWQQFLTQLAQRLNCESGALLVTDLTERENTQFLYGYNISPDYRQRYEKSLNRQDVFNYYLSKNPLQVFCSQTLPAGEIEAVEKPKGLKPNEYRFGLSIPCNQQHSLNLVISRPEEFDEQEQDAAQQLLKHILAPLKNAIHSEQLYKINSQLIYYLGGHFDAYIIIDNELNILISDPLYIDMIGALDCVNIKDGKFGLHNPLIERRLLQAIDEKRLENSIHKKSHNCQISLIPIASLENFYHWECCKNAFILSFVLDTHRNPAIDRLVDIRELSRCDTASAAPQSMQTPSIHDITTNTLRSQEMRSNYLKHTMQKMQVHNQADLMKKLIALSSL